MIFSIVFGIGTIISLIGCISSRNYWENIKDDTILGIKIVSVEDAIKISEVSQQCDEAKFNSLLKWTISVIFFGFITLISLCL